MAKLTPEQFREKHARRLKGAIEDMRRGIEQVNEAPGVKAAEAVDKMRARLLQAIDDGKWSRKVSAVSLNEWKQAMLNKGLGRIAAGIDGSADKVEKFAAQLLSYQDNLKAKLEGMPDLTLEDSIQRMITWIRGMADFKPE